MTSTQMNLLDGLKKDLLGAADVEIRGHRYISKAALDKILPFDIVVQALSQCLSPITAELASQYAKAITFGKEVSEEDSIPDWRAVKLFAILICCDAAREIVRVLDAGVADGELPFKLDKGVSPEVLRYGARGRKTEILGCSRSWDLSLKQSFESYQKDFAPFLLRGRDFLFQVKEYWSDSDDSSGLGIPIPPIPAIKILPTVERDGPDPNRETKNSETFRVKFHPACHGLSAQNSLGQEPNLAITRLSSWYWLWVTHELQKILRLEKALDLVDNLHLVKVLSAFFFQKQLHCITCWAYGDISTYYTVVKPRQVTNDEFALWFARQWEGVAHVLRVLEKQKDSYPTRIIPNRLLWFSPGSVEGSDKENGVIQLDVFGCYTSQLTTGMPLSSGGKPYYKRSSYLVERFQTYGAPEIDGRDRHLDFSVDVWGLGCILLEAVTWLLMGADALNSEFCQARENDPLCDNGNAFHGESHQSRRTPVRHHNRVVLPSVSQWIKQLHNHSQCTQYLHELLNLIEGRMLVVEPKSRIGLEELWTVLCGLTQNVKETPGYGSRPRKRGLLHNLLRK